MFSRLRSALCRFCCRSRRSRHLPLPRFFEAIRCHPLHLRAAALTRLAVPIPTRIDPATKKDVLGFSPGMTTEELDAKLRSPDCKGGDQSPGVGRQCTRADGSLINFDVTVFLKPARVCAAPAGATASRNHCSVSGARPNRIRRTLDGRGRFNKKLPNEKDRMDGHTPYLRVCPYKSRHGDDDFPHPIYGN